MAVFNKDSDSRVEACIQLEFKMKHYLSSNPLISGENYGREFKLDLVAKEILEIFSNQLRVAIEKLNVIRKYQTRKGIKISNDISPIRANPLKEYKDSTPRLPSNNKQSLNLSGDMNDQ